MAEEEVKRIRRFIHEPYGMFLVTGPTGSGKTTTLYAALSEIYNDEDKIITIEDPVEYQLKGVTQIPVNEKKGLTFSRGLRSILRHDPDKVMVGEIRDAETAQIAINAALTGHLVFTTVHANNVVDVIGRFLNMGVEAYNFVSALNCILAQRLIRSICPFCKRPFKPDAQLLEDSGLDERYAEHVFYRGEGCIQCSGTGYKGRHAISELLDLNDEIREMLIERRPSAEIKNAAKKAGMTFLRESAPRKSDEGANDPRGDQPGHVRGGDSVKRPHNALLRWLVDPEPPGLGLDLRDGELSLARLADKRGKPEIDLCVTSPLPPECLSFAMLEPNIVDPALFKTSLENVLLRSGTAGAKRIALTLPDFLARITILEVPDAPRSSEELEQMLKFRLEEVHILRRGQRTAGLRPASCGDAHVLDRAHARGRRLSI